MKKSIVLSATSVLLAAVLFSGCQSKPSDENAYISFTLTSSTQADDKFDMSTYYIDTNAKKEAQIMSTLPYSSQYPLTVYDKENGAVYFTALAQDKKGDELFVYDLETKKTTQLTNDFFAINYLFPVKNGVFIGAAQRGELTAVRPFIYDTEKKSVTDLTFDNDFFINCACCSPDGGKVYIAGYSEKEAMRVADDENNGITNSVYAIDGTSITKIKDEDNCYINTIAFDKSDDSLVYKCADRLFDSNDTVYKYNPGKNTRTAIDIQDSMLNLIDDIFYCDDEKLYCICSEYIDDDEISSLCSIDTKSQHKAVLFEAQKNSKINNAQILS